MNYTPVRCERPRPLKDQFPSFVRCGSPCTTFSFFFLFLFSFIERGVVILLALLCGEVHSNSGRRCEYGRVLNDHVRVKEESTVKSYLPRQLNMMYFVGLRLLSLTSDITLNCSYPDLIRLFS